MKSIHRSILTRRVDDRRGVAGLHDGERRGGVRADIVTVQGDDGAAGADGVNSGDNGAARRRRRVGFRQRRQCSRSPPPRISHGDRREWRRGR